MVKLHDRDGKGSSGDSILVTAVAVTYKKSYSTIIFVLKINKIVFSIASSNMSDSKLV